VTFSDSWHIDKALQSFRHPMTLTDKEVQELLLRAQGPPAKIRFTARRGAVWLMPLALALLGHAYAYPKADVPVVQLSINAGEGLRYHFELGKKLAALRARGVFILGSGNVVHNLRRIDWGRPEGAFDWGQRFDADVKRIMTTKPQEILAIETHADYAASVPTPEHFLPLPYLAGLCDASGQGADLHYGERRQTADQNHQQRRQHVSELVTIMNRSK